VIRNFSRIPLPSIVTPYEDTTSETIARNRYRDRVEPVTLIQRIERASKERCMAWSPLFEIEDKFPQAKAGSSTYDQSTCEKILSRLKREPATGRLRRLIALIKSIRGNGERFLINMTWNAAIAERWRNREPLPRKLKEGTLPSSKRTYSVSLP